MSACLGSGTRGLASVPLACRPKYESGAMLFQVLGAVFAVFAVVVVLKLERIKKKSRPLYVVLSAILVGGAALYLIAAIIRLVEEWK
jgi:RsiW-degrading membrane proteinase PrsW (M82 family)